MSGVRQCPRCELRFAANPALRDHLERDHGVAPESLDFLRPPAARVGTTWDPEPATPGDPRRDRSSDR